MSYLLCLFRAHTWLDLSQTFANEEYAIDEQSIRRSLDLKVSEERVCAEETQDLIQRIVRLAIGIYIQGI